MDCFVAALLAMTLLMGKQPAVYIVANRKNGAIYTGATSDLVARIWQHREA
jgi:putative endonuclease